MEGISTLLRAGEWIVKVDLKDPYFPIPIDPRHQQYPKFTVDLSCAPWTFTKVMKPSMGLSRAQGIQIIIYMHKRHADTGGVQGISCAALGSADLSPRSSGLHYQQGEVYPVPSSETGVPGFGGRFTPTTSQAIQQKDDTDPQRSKTASEEGACVSMTALPVSWLAECGLSSYTGCSPILQGIARGPAKGAGRAHLVTESPGMGEQ